MRRSAFALFAVLAGLAPASAQTAAPDPYAIFAGARHYWEGQHYPARLGYTVTVDVLEGGAHKVEHYTSAFDAVNGVVQVDPVTDYEIAHPASGRGINLGFMGALKLGKPDPPVDFVGVPSLAPNYSFAIARFVPSDAHAKTPAELVREVRAEFHDLQPTPAPTALPSADGLREIAIVSSTHRRYDITLVGVESIDDAPAYHLALRPTGDPHRYRLRDLWVDVATGATRRLIDAGNFVDGPWPGLTWTVDFAAVDGALYVASEHAAEPVAFRGLRYLETTVSFSDIHPATETALDEIAQYRPNNRDLFAKEPVDP